MSSLRKTTVATDLIASLGLAGSVERLGFWVREALDHAASMRYGSRIVKARIQRALELKGIIFIDQDDKQGPGVRLKKPLR